MLIGYKSVITVDFSLHIIFIGILSGPVDGYPAEQLLSIVALLNELVEIRRWVL